MVAQPDHVPAPAVAVAAMPNIRTGAFEEIVVVAVAVTEVELALTIAAGTASNGDPGSTPENARIAPPAPVTVPGKLNV